MQILRALILHHFLSNFVLPREFGFVILDLRLVTQ